MCDYSITALKTRDAEIGDKLIVRYFGASKGFAPQGLEVEKQYTAVCLRPGTELAFDAPVSYCDYMIPRTLTHVHTEHKTAIFRQVDKEIPDTHHDMLEFPDGSETTLTLLDQGQTATVLQLPVSPKNEAEVVEQTRAEYVG